jgi:hypothetical protein
MKENLICKILCGSNLYGLNTPESDKDYKGVFVPPIEDMVLGRESKVIHRDTGNDSSKNSKDDIDYEIFSIQKFMSLVKSAQPMALEMLFAPDEFIVESTPIWDIIRANKHKLICNKVKAFVGYCKGQASKYCLKGKRLKSVETLMGFMDEYEHDKPISNEKFDDICMKMKGNRYFKIVEPSPCGARTYEILDKKFAESVRVRDVMKSLTNLANKYGHRARKAKNLNDADWKAVSHAVRIAVEAKELLSTGNITLPLQGEEKKIVMDVKLGKIPLPEVEGILEAMLDEVDELHENTVLPNKVNEKQANDFILSIYGLKEF